MKSLLVVLLSILLSSNAWANMDECMKKYTNSYAYGKVEAEFAIACAIQELGEKIETASLSR